MNTLALWEQVFLFCLGFTVCGICTAIFLGVSALRATRDDRLTAEPPPVPAQPIVIESARAPVEAWLYPTPVRYGQAPTFDQLAERLPHLAAHRTKFRDWAFDDPYRTGAFPVLSEIDDDAEADPPTPPRDRFSYQPIPGSTAVLDKPKSKRKGRKPQQVTVTVAGETRSQVTS